MQPPDLTEDSEKVTMASSCCCSVSVADVGFRVKCCCDVVHAGEEAVQWKVTAHLIPDRNVGHIFARNRGPVLRPLALAVTRCYK